MKPPATEVAACLLYPAVASELSYVQGGCLAIIVCVQFPNRLRHQAGCGCATGLIIPRCTKRMHACML